MFNRFPLSINNHGLSFNQKTFKSSIREGLLYIEDQPYERIKIDNSIEITLPKLENYNFEEILLTDQTINIFYGKNQDSDEFYIQYNDKLYSIDSLKEILYPYLEDVYKNIYKIALFCDHTVKMKDVELLFLHFNNIGFKDIFLVNDEQQKFHTERGEIKSNRTFHKVKFILPMNYDYRVKFPPNNYGYSYDQMIYMIQNNKPFEYTFLINDAYYYGKEKLSKKAFSEKVEASVRSKTSLIMLYDLESTYKSYLEIISIYKQALDKERNKTAISLFNSSFEELDEDQKEHIKNLHRYINIRHYSIPHFMSFENFPFENIKSQLPTSYFE